MMYPDTQKKAMATPSTKEIKGHSFVYPRPTLCLSGWLHERSNLNSNDVIPVTGSTGRGEKYTVQSQSSQQI